MVTPLSFYVLSFLLSSSTSEPDGQLGSPRHVHRCGLLCSPVLSLCSSLYLPSRVGALIRHWAGDGAQGPCQRFVLPESAGLALFRSLTVPLIGPVSSCCRCFTLSCPFSLALPYWLTLLLHPRSFHIIPTSPHNWHYVPLAEVCWCNSLLPVPIINKFAPNIHHSHYASGPVVSHACSRRCHH